MEYAIPNSAATQNIVGLAAFAILLVWETVRPFFPFFKGHPKLRGAHLARNVAIGLLNGVLVLACFSFLWRTGMAWSAETGFGLLYRGGLPGWAHAIAAVLLLDLWTYGWHRANHRIPWLWRLHRVHHSDPWMDVTTARRFHPGEILPSSALRIPLLALLGIHLWELALYGTLLMVVIDFHHANIAVPERLDRWLRIFIATPAMHKVHHSRIQAETDSNYTSLLSFWDRVFGSFRLRPDLSAIEPGLDEWSAETYQSLPGMLATPFVNDSGKPRAS